MDECIGSSILQEELFFPCTSLLFCRKSFFNRVDFPGCGGHQYQISYWSDSKELEIKKQVDGLSGAGSYKVHVVKAFGSRLWPNSYRVFCPQNWVGEDFVYQAFNCLRLELKGCYVKQTAQVANTASPSSPHFGKHYNIYPNVVLAILLICHYPCIHIFLSQGLRTSGKTIRVCQHRHGGWCLDNSWRLRASCSHAGFSHQ